MTIIRTTKGKTIGGYTEQTWKTSKNEKQKIGEFKQDKNAFLFSLDKKKIYNISVQPAIWCHPLYGPCFAGRKGFGIYSKEKLINDVMRTNIVQESYYSGMEKDYELNDGKEKFYALEIEVFQILFN